MTTRKRADQVGSRSAYSVHVQAPVNGRVHKATITAQDPEGAIHYTDRENLAEACGRRRAAKRLTNCCGGDPQAVEQLLGERWAEALNQRGREQQQHRDAAAAPNEIAAEVLDSMPDVLRRPLALMDGRAYAAAWLSVRSRATRATDPKTGESVVFDPPRLQNHIVQVIVRDDGEVFVADPAMAEVLHARTFSELSLDVALPTPPLPASGWSGAGFNRFRAGERSNPAEVFERVVAVVDRFLDFGRSLGAQRHCCELLACYILGTYLLDGFNVVGYIWPNGERGSGKTTLLQVVTEIAYLGNLILANSSCASLRDLADYGATLAFDDAEGIMDTRRADPDKRGMLLAGNRRGAKVTVKEPAGDKQWVTRHVDTFCPRLFSAIRLPDPVLSSRTITIPLVRSGDPNRAKSNPLDHGSWPHDRRRLIDDLWSLGLTYLPAMPACDKAAAAKSPLVGRDLEPWRMILAVAWWLQEQHQMRDVHERMTALAANYQSERCELEADDPTRLLVRALVQMIGDDLQLSFKAGDLAKRINELAHEEELAESLEGEKAFTNPKRLGWIIKRLRLQRAPGSRRGRLYLVTAAEVMRLAQAHGVAITTPDDGG